MELVYDVPCRPIWRELSVWPACTRENVEIDDDRVAVFKEKPLGVLIAPHHFRATRLSSGIDTCFQHPIFQGRGCSVVVP